MINNFSLKKYFKVLAFTSVFLSVYLFSVILVEAATLSVSPSTGVYTAGQTFSARVMVNTSGQSINAADGTLSFNPSELSVVGVSKGSIFNLWTADPSYSNTAGTITFSGGNPTGYNGSAGTVMSITFRAKNSGTAKVSFSKGSVLAADGRGTNVLTSMGGGTFTIAAKEVVPEPETIEYIAPANTPAAPSITSSTHPDQSKYYQTKDARLSWSLPSDITSVRTLLDGNSGSIPTKVYDTPISDISLTDLDEGVQYFHLQFKNEDGWGRVSHYRLAVDTQAPSSFTIELPEEADLSNPEQTLLLKAEDEASKVLRFTVQLDGGEPYEYVDNEESGSIALPALDPGQHSVIIEAFDEAGNSLIDTFSFAILAFDKPQFTEYPSEINEEVIPVIKGITRPNATVGITLSKLGAEPSEYTVNSDESGVFTFIPEGRLSLGVYEIGAVAIDQYGAKSEPADTIRLAVQQPGYLQIGSVLISVMSVIVPLIALLLLLVLAVVFFFGRLRKLRAGVVKESKEAIAVLEEEFNRLQKLLTEQKDALADSRKSKSLTKAETALVDNMFTALQESNKRVKDELEDVEDIVE